jgi:hypothetical protein
MAEVPGSQYEPYFTAQPTERPIQLRGVDYPSGAFGENIAHALQTFGGDIEKGSDEVFNRAMALRRLQIDGSIRDLTTAYYNDASKEQTKFLSALGSNAGPDAQNAHLANIEAIRQQYLEQAKQYGAYGENRFGNEAASMQRSFIRETSIHSAQQTKGALKDSHKASILALQDQARGAKPEDLPGINSKIEKEVDSISTMDGATPEKRAWDRKEAVSLSNAQNTVGQMDRNPVDAPSIADKAISSGNLDAAAQDLVRQRAMGKIPEATRVIHRGMLTGSIPVLGERKHSPDRLVDVVYGMEGRGRGPLITNPDSPYRGQRALPGGLMPGNLAPWLKEAGMKAMTEEEYANDPAAQRQLMSFKLNQFQEKYGNANDAFAMWFTGSPATPESMRRTDRQDGWKGITGLEYIKRANQKLAEVSTAKDMGDAARVIGEGQQSQNFQDIGEQYREAVVAHQLTEEGRVKRQGWDTRIALGNAIRDGNPQTGQPYVDYNEFAANPNNAQLIAQGQQSTPGFEAQTARLIKGFNDAHMTQTNIGHKHDLITMADGTREEREKFLDMNFFADKQLSNRDMIFFHNLQSRMVRQGAIHPHLNQAYNDLANQYPNEVPVKANDEEGFKNYKSRLFTAMQAWEEVNKKPLIPGSAEGNKALQDIHQMLMQQQPGGLFGFKRAAYRTEPDIPEDYTKLVKAANPQATDDEVRYSWIKGQDIAEFERMYTKSATAPTPGVHLRPNTIRGRAPVTPPITPPSPTPAQEPAPSNFDVSQRDPIIQYMQKVGGKAIGDWIKQVVEEVKAGAGTAKAGLEQAQKEATEERERELPEEVIGKKIK